MNLLSSLLAAKRGNQTVAAAEVKHCLAPSVPHSQRQRAAGVTHHAGRCTYLERRENKRERCRTAQLSHNLPGDSGIRAHEVRVGGIAQCAPAKIDSLTTKFGQPLCHITNGKVSPPVNAVQLIIELSVAVIWVAYGRHLHMRV